MLAQLAGAGLAGWWWFIWLVLVQLAGGVQPSDTKTNPCSPVKWPYSLLDGLIEQ